MDIMDVLHQCQVLGTKFCAIDDYVLNEAIRDLRQEKGGPPAEGGLLLGTLNEILSNGCEKCKTLIRESHITDNIREFIFAGVVR